MLSCDDMLIRVGVLVGRSKVMKKRKSGCYGATFTSLGRRRGDCMVGVWVLKIEVNYL